MNNFIDSNLRNYFFYLLLKYLNSSFDNEEKKFLELLYTINTCQHCESAEKIGFLNPKQNLKSNIIVLLDPFFLYEDYKENDKPGIYELFWKILKSIKLLPDDIYLTYSLKCILKRNFFQNKKIYKDIFMKELQIVNAENILIFGQYAHELLFDQLKDVKYSNISEPVQLYGRRLFFTSSPVEIFYDPSLKKDVWEFLKFFKKTVK